MLEVRQTETFSTWLHGLRNAVTQARIETRIERLAEGNPGQTRTLTGGVIEMKLAFGAGYRLYFTRRGETIVILLCGGNKSTQAKDIKTALKLAAQL